MRAARPPAVALVGQAGDAWSHPLQQHQLTRIFDWQRLQHYSVDGAEDGGVRADAQSQSQNGDNRESRAAPQLTQPVARVLDQRLDHGEPSLFPICLLYLLDSAKGAEGGVACFFGSHSLPPILLDQHLQVGAHFLVEFLLKLSLAEKGQETRPRNSQ